MVFYRMIEKVHMNHLFGNEIFIIYSYCNYDISMCDYFFLCCKISIGKNDAKEIMKEREVMYKIAYVVPFFGKFPKGFRILVIKLQM